MNDVTKVEELEEECSELETLEGSENYIRNCKQVLKEAINQAGLISRDTEDESHIAQSLFVYALLEFGFEYADSFDDAYFQDVCNEVINIGYEMPDRILKNYPEPQAA